MALFSPLARRLLLPLLCVTFFGQAEPIVPLLRPTDAARLRAQLKQTLPDTTRAQLLLSLAYDQLNRHEEFNVSLDSAAAYAKEAQSLSTRARFVSGQIGSLYALGRLRNYSTTDTLGRTLLRQGIALSQHQQRPVLQAYGWFYLAETYPENVHNDDRIVLYDRSQALFQQAGARLQAAFVLKAIAGEYIAHGNITLAIEKLQQVLARYRAAGHRELHYTYDYLLIAHLTAGNYQEALRYGLATLESAKATHDTVSIGLFYRRVGNLSSDVRQHEQALAYFRKALANYQYYNDKKSILEVAGEIVQQLIGLNRAQEALDFYTRATRHAAAANPTEHAVAMAECYAALGRYSLAEKHYLHALRYAEKIRDDSERKWVVSIAIGRFYQRTKQYDKARPFLQANLLYLQRTGYVLGQAKLHRRLFAVDSAQGRYVSAIGHYQRYKLLTDSLYNEAKSKQLASLQVQHETRKKEHDIALLTKEALVQQARLRQREWQRNALLIGAGGLVLLLGLGLNRYRLKQRVNRLLEAQQEQIRRKNAALEAVVGDKQRLLEEKEALLEEKGWMLKEIHHRVKNNLQIISSLLSTQLDFLREPAALAALRESQNRVQAMALVHQKLYQSEHLALVDMQEYIEDITAQLLDSFDCRGAVRARLEVAPARLDVALATPLGLILNEAITNALKHAFPPGRGGTLTVGLRPLGDQRFELLIADDGVGLPLGLERRRHASLGLTMIEGLSKQLGGALRLTHQGGTQLTLQFRAARKTPRPETAPA